MITCRSCGQEGEPHKSNPHLCVDCVKVENNRMSHFRQHNFDWMELAKEAEIELYDRQPAETDREWQIWVAYRDAYPSVRPSYMKTAEQLGTTENAVRKAGFRWDFAVRLQAWATHVDELTRAQRQKEIVDMNKKHIDMATTLNQKLSDAINNIDPFSLKPNEIQGLLKLTSELERTARIDQPEANKPAFALTDPNVKESTIKSGDIEEVLKILGQSGVLGKKPQVGVRQTTTTEVVVKED